MKSSTLAKGKRAVVPSERIRKCKEEDTKLELTFIAKC